jgi:hypothetical protein
MSEIPHFVIVGAPKCGTTALFHYLSRHRAIFMPSLKEPHFFCTDLKIRGAIRGLPEYTALFAAAPPGRVTGEASVLYLYSKVALERIMARNPNAKIIAILRNPVDAAHSLHAAAWAYGHESIEDFEEAWHLQTERLADLLLAPYWPDAPLQYRAIYQYSAQIQRLLNVVPERQRHIMIYEEFFADPGRSFAELLAFLDVAPAASEVFPIVNPAMGSKSRAVDRFLRRPPDWVRLIYAPLRPLFRAVGLRPKTLIWNLNSVPQRKSVLRPHFRTELENYFTSDIAQLERLLGRPVGLWHRG